MENHGAWHIYGHVHGNRDDGTRYDAIEYMYNKGRALNAGCMLNGFTPASFEELIINNQSFWEDEIDD